LIIAQNTEFKTFAIRHSIDSIANTEGFGRGKITPSRDFPLTREHHKPTYQVGEPIRDAESHTKHEHRKSPTWGWEKFRVALPSGLSRAPALAPS